jgi:hypothetical protein
MAELHFKERKVVVANSVSQLHVSDLFHRGQLHG